MRNSNFELLRIVCMLLIVLSHIDTQHRGEMNFQSFDYLVDFIVLHFACVAVNSFVLISGYWGIHFKFQKLLKLNAQTLFYSLAIFLFTLWLGWHSFSFTKDIGVFLPIFSKQYWFITVYYTLYLLSPVLNLFCENLSKRNFQILLVLGFVLFYLWPTGCYLINVRQLIDDAGFGIINFTYLYLLGRYIKLHFTTPKKATYWLIGYILFCSIALFTQLTLSLLLGFEFTSFHSYNTIFILGGSICLLLCFSKLNIHSIMINNFAKHCLAVYLIHTGPYFWEHFCEKFSLKEYTGISYIILLFCAPVAIYIVCVAIEYLRQVIMGNFEDKIINKICMKSFFKRIQFEMTSLKSDSNKESKL